MGWIFFQESVESESRSSLGFEQSPIASVTDTHRASYCPGCDLVTLTERPYGTTSQRSEERCCQESTSSSEDSHAKISVLQAVEQAWQESEADFFSRLSGSSKSADLDLFSSRMSRPSGVEVSTLCSKSSPRSGMTVDGQLYRPPQLEPHTKETDGFSWPTPTVCGNYQNKGNMIGLATAVKMWPMPRASEYKDCGPVGSKSQVHMEKRNYLCAKAKDPSIPTGQLNPQWVEWLMGYQIGHTELSALETAWYHSKLGRHSKSFQD